MNEIFEKIRKAVDIELDSLKHFRDNLGKEAADAVSLILSCKGKVITTGVGKSGDIAKKISSTFSSTGTPSIFLHPTDAAHGDAGIISRDDILFAIGKSGESDELFTFLPTVKKIGAKIIAVTANFESRLAKYSDICVLTPVLKEACPLELAPTSSTTIALVLGDAIAMALMELRGFREEDFALYHPSGRLGKRLSLQIDDVMRKGEKNAIVHPDTNFQDLLGMITGKGVGATSVVGNDGKLIGFITDFDIRRAITGKSVPADITARMIMNAQPLSFKSNMRAYDVLLGMEQRDRPVSVVPIIDEQGIAVGIVTLHDLLQVGLK